eukprot:9498670-Pyramimonas_sp.AAC.1
MGTLIVPNGRQRPVYDRQAGFAAFRGPRGDLFGRRWTTPTALLAPPLARSACQGSGVQRHPKTLLG